MIYFNVHSGVNIPKKKDNTKNKSIEVSKPPKLLYFPMSMHIGKPANINVAIGDNVKIGSLLGTADGTISANIHSSVSGKVVDIVEMDGFRGNSKTVVVENDFKDEKISLEKLDDRIDVDTFVQRLLDAGITGKGGAGFPTSIKYKAEKDKMRYIVINGAECEPYSTTDHRIMIEYADQIVKTVNFIGNIYEIEQEHIAIEGHMEEAIKSLKLAIEKNEAANISIHELGDEYPQGHAGLQIREVLGIEIEEGSRTGDVGVLQSNVSTIKAIHDAIFLGDPLTKRAITISGEMINNPKNLMVRNGTPISHLIDECEGLKSEDITLINGGPMMGKIFEDTSYPADKDTTTILALEHIEAQEETACIRCSRCVHSCPVALQPIVISNAYKNNEVHKVPSLRSQTCISCGVCTYICPANIPLLENIQAINKQWKEIQNG